MTSVKPLSFIKLKRCKKKHIEFRPNMAFALTASVLTSFSVVSTVGSEMKAKTCFLGVHLIDIVLL